MRRTSVNIILGTKYLSYFFFVCFFSCGEKTTESEHLHTIEAPAQIPPATAIDSFPIKFANNKVQDLHPTVLSMYEDKQGNYWYGTNGGLFRYDGQHLLRFTRDDGLAQNQIQNIQQDEAGKLWIATGGFGLNAFDGKKITTPSVVTHPTTFFRSAKTLWFKGGSGAMYLRNDSVVYLTFIAGDKASKPNTNYKNLNVLSVYSLLKDKQNNVWFGTQASGVCKFDGANYTWYKDKGLAGPAVLALAEDNAGLIWMGNNGSGLFYFDGTRLVNYTEQQRLANPDFVTKGSAKSNSLARITALQKDKSGVLYIGTADAGLWSIENKHVLHLASVETFENKGIECIFCDKKGAIWLGTNGAGLYKLDGNFVSKVAIKGSLGK